MFYALHGKQKSFQQKLYLLRLPVGVPICPTSLQYTPVNADRAFFHIRAIPHNYSVISA
jgi:hypothetical protein